MDRNTRTVILEKRWKICSTVCDVRNAGTFPRHILPIQPRMNMCTRSWALYIFKNIWISTYFGLMMVDSVGDCHHSAFSRYGFKLAIFLIAFMNCISWDASFELILNLAILDPEKLQGFHGILIFHCYTLLYQHDHVYIYMIMCISIWPPHMCDMTPVLFIAANYFFHSANIYVYMHLYMYVCI